ncbi:hypothetical protein AAG906_005001 [Vitis piasezkii]
MRARHTHVIDEDDDDDEDEEVYMYPVDMDLDERDAYQEAFVLFRDAKKGFGDRATVSSRSTMVPGEYYLLIEKNLLSLFTFALIHTKQCNCLAYSRLEQLVFCYYNMKLKLRDMEAENDRVDEKYYLDLLDISAEISEENQLFQCFRPIHLDDEVGNLDLQVATHAREFGVDVEHVLSEEVHSESFSKDVADSFQMALNSHQEVDSTSIGQSSRPSAAGTSAFGYDGSRGGTDDGSDHTGGDIGEHQQSQYPISQFTCENDFTHCTQDEDLGSRRAGLGIEVIRNPYRGREQMRLHIMMSYFQGVLNL